MAGLDRERVDSTRIAHRAGARVTLELDWDALEPGIEVRFVPKGTRPLTEDLLAIWEQSVHYGVRFALAVAGTLPCGVRVTEVNGEPGHTRPTLIAAAAAAAVWQALGFEPPEPIAASVRARVEEAFEQGPLWLAEFGT